MYLTWTSMSVASTVLALISSLAESGIQTRDLPNEPRQRRPRSRLRLRVRPAETETEPERPGRDPSRSRRRVRDGVVRGFEPWHEVEASVGVDQTLGLGGSFWREI